MDILNELDSNFIGNNNILIFTASLVDQREIERMLKEGAKGIVHKPLAIEELEQIIQIHLKQ